MPQFGRICISALIAIATLASSVPIAYSGSQSFGTFRSQAACRAKGKRLVRSGVIRRYRCLRSGNVWKLRSASDSDRGSGVYGATRTRSRRSNKYRTYRTTRTTRRSSRAGRYSSRHSSMAACRRRGRALVRAGKISSFRCVPVR
jgi:hypothetical protein